MKPGLDDSACNSIQPHDIHRFCSHCSVAEVCIPVSLAANGVQAIESLISSGPVLHAGEHLYQEGAPFRSLFAVRSGVFKSYTVDATGTERVLGFHLAGEMMGFDGIAYQHYRSSAISLDTGVACRFAFASMLEAANRIPELQHGLFRLISREIYTHRHSICEQPARERIVWFLLDFSRRLSEHGQSATHFLLPMRRQEIANFLNLTPETVSRIFAKLQSDGVIRLQRKELWINNLKDLQRYSPSLGTIDA